MNADTTAKRAQDLPAAARFWISLLLVPLALVGAAHGGWTVLLLAALHMVPVLRA